MSSTDTTTTLAAWLHNEGGFVHKGVDLCYALPGGDRGIVATDALEDGTLILRVPESCTLSAPLGVGCERTNARGTQSPFRPYFDALPQELDCLLLWGDSDKRELTGTAVDVSGELQDNGLASAFTSLVAPALAAHPDLWPPAALEDAGKVALEALHAAEAKATAATAAVSAVNGSSAVSTAAVASGPLLEPPVLAAFRRAAAMVQSRAFHMERQNWVTGVEEECLDLFLIPGIDMVNHATDPARRNTALLRVPATLDRVRVTAAAREASAAGMSASAADEGATTGSFELRASRAIAAGEELLHTYGDMADTRLLQIYGFVDAKAAALPVAALDAVNGEEAAAGQKKSREESAKGVAAGDGVPARFVNPHNSALVPWPLVLQCCREVISSGGGAQQVDESDEEGSDEEAADRSKAAGHKGKRAPPMAAQEGRSTKKPKSQVLVGTPAVLTPMEKRQVALLQHMGLLQPSDPADTCFVLTAEDPLPNEMLTVLQVLLMSAGELKQLERHTRGTQPGRGTVSLGTRLMEAEPDFGEVVCMALMKVVDVCLARYPASTKEDASTLVRLRNRLPPRRLWALLARMGERDVLQACRKASLMLLMSLEGDEGESEDGSEDEGSGDDSKGDEADDDPLYNSDDSDKVGLADLPVDDDGVGAVHDRGASHALPPPSDDDSDEEEAKQAASRRGLPAPARGSKVLAAKHGPTQGETVKGQQQAGNKKQRK